MTFVELSRDLSIRCADAASGNSDGKRFTAEQRLSALNGAVKMTVNFILSGSTETRKPHDVLQSLVTVEEHDVNADGLPLSNLSNKVSSAGIKFVEILIGASWVPAVERTVDELRLRRNRYLAGTDEAPTYYIASDRLFVQITVGSYPVRARLYFIRVPKTGVYSAPSWYETTEFELPDNLSEAVLSAAEMILYKSTDDRERVKDAYELFISQVTASVQESLADNEQLGGIKQ